MLIKPDNPTIFAEAFSKAESAKGYSFDFSLPSLESEVDKYLESLANINRQEKAEAERNLTAYIGETMCRLYNGKWTGEYYGSLNRHLINFYSCKVSIDGFDFWPSHFIGYYFENGEPTTGTFYNYLYTASLPSLCRKKTIPNDL